MNFNGKAMIPLFRDIVGKDRIFSEPEELICYGYDATPIAFHAPDIVIKPKNSDQIYEIMKVVNAYKIPIVPRGTGSGLSGGSIPIKGGIVLPTTDMNKILDIDRENLTILVEPGVITSEINDTVSSLGLFYPPDPASMKTCTIGGNVAENSGGLRCLKYGVTGDYVLGLDMISGAGKRLRYGTGCMKDVAGYNMTKLMVGSEGTLGIFTKILLKLVPLPETKNTAVAFFADMVDAAKTVADIIAAKILPTTLEFLDSTTIRCVEDFAKIGLPLDQEAMLLIETDGYEDICKKEMREIINICRNNKATAVEEAKSDKDAERLTAARRMALSALARVKPTTILEDITVPRNKLPEMVKYIQITANKYKLNIATFGHAGDGNLHPTCLTNDQDKDELKRVDAAYEEIFKKAVSIGGTITGEHGTGIVKSKYLSLLATKNEIEIMKKIKSIFDPNMILNPGKIFYYENSKDSQ